MAGILEFGETVEGCGKAGFGKAKLEIRNSKLGNPRREPE